MKEKNKFSSFYSIGLIILIPAVVLFGIYEINYLMEYKKRYDILEEGKKRYEAMLTEIGEKHKELLEQNRDYVGWINVSGTNIEYPMVQGKDNEKYLNIDFQGNSDSNGSIFVDSKVVNPFQDKVTIIYGSNKILGDITKFEDRQFFNDYNNGTITINLDGRQELYSVFSVFYDEDNVEKYKYNFSKEEDFFEYIDYLAEKSINIDDILDSKYADSIIILETPVNGQESKKVVLAAIKKRGITTTYN